MKEHAASIFLMLFFVTLTAFCTTFTAFGCERLDCPRNYFNNPFIDHKCDDCVDGSKVRVYKAKPKVKNYNNISLPISSRHIP